MTTVGTIPLRSVRPSNRSVASSNGTATPDSTPLIWIRAPDLSLTGSGTSTAKVLIASGGCCRRRGTTSSAKGSTPRRPRAPWLSASCSYPATGTRPVARCASTVRRRAPTCSRRRPGSRAAVQAHDMTTEISGEELRERMRAVLKDCAARHSKSEKQVCAGYSFDSAKEKRCYRPVGATPVLSSEINNVTPAHRFSANANNANRDSYGENESGGATCSVSIIELPA